MLLHAGAGLHGHEYSSSSKLKEQPDTHTRNLPSQSSALPTVMESPHKSRPTSQLLPGISYVSSLMPSAKSFWPRTSSDYFIKNYLPTHFREMKADLPSTTSSVLNSRDGGLEPLSTELEPEISPNSGSTCSSSQYSRVKRAKTRFSFARPAPGTHHKSRKFQPRILLQLRREEQGRSVPTIEVVPAGDIRGTKLDGDDILVMRSDHDKSASWLGSERASHATLGEQDILAVISPRLAIADGGAEIAMEDGTAWLAHRRPNGTYEFNHTDQNGNNVIVRWVKRHAPSSSASPYFSFCIMDPLVRKHPFLGSLKADGLDIFATFTPPFYRLDSSRPASFANDGSLVDCAPKSVAAVSDEHRRLMTATAIWISFCEDSLPAYLPASRTRSCRTRSAALSRRLSDGPVQSPTPSTPASPTQELFTQFGSETRRLRCPSQRSTSTGVAYMDRRRATARASSPSSHNSVDDKARPAKASRHHGRIRAWARKLLPSGHKGNSGAKQERLEES